jgi:uncharacterized phage protein (TIGR02220 family)
MGEGNLLNNNYGGFIPLYRKLLENPIINKDSDHLAVFLYLLLKATHTEYAVIFEGSQITLKPGQLITGRKVISLKYKINESKVQRILKLFNNEQLIEQQTSSLNRLITIVSWGKYSLNKQQIEQPLNNDQTTDEQPLNTNNNINNINKKKKENIDPSLGFLGYIKFINGTFNRNYRGNSKIERAFWLRMKEGYTNIDFRTAIGNAKDDTFHKENSYNYLTPEFFTRCDKLDRYINAKKVHPQGGTYTAATKRL